MKIKKLFILTILFLSFSFSLFSQEADVAPENQTAETKTDKSFFERLDFFFGLTPSLYINTEKTTISAPSPLFYPIYLGIQWPNDTWLSFSPSIRFYTNYYLVSGNKVLPAEIENRTAIAYSFFLNLPVGFNILNNNLFQVRAFSGLGILIRFATLASKVSPDDYGSTGTAKDDLKVINSWFYKNAHFLYLTGGIDCLFKLTKNVNIGPELYINIPLGSLFTQFSLQEFMISLGAKIQF